MTTVLETELASTGPFVIIVSIILYVLISIAGVISSIIITVANIIFFGFETD